MSDVYLGVGAADITKLKANGFYTVAVRSLLSSSDVLHMLILALVQSVHGATRKTLLKIKGFSEVKVEKVKEAIQKCLVSIPPPSSTVIDPFFLANDQLS